MNSKATLKRVPWVAGLATTALFGAMAAHAEFTADFSNPATAISGEAIIASGTCIAKYAVALDDRTKTAAEIGRLVADRCAKEISKAAGLSAWMIGKPDDYAKNLQYIREELTANAVLRVRAATDKSRLLARQ